MPEECTLLFDIPEVTLFESRDLQREGSTFVRKLATSFILDITLCSSGVLFVYSFITLCNRRKLDTPERGLY